MQPLAERLRPQSLDDYMGQEHLLGAGAPLRSMINSGQLPSLILWGPPGIGKTTLARLLAQESGRPLYSLSAVDAGVKELRELLQRAKKQNLFQQGKSPLLFIDEIHRFSKSQQDALLSAVEQGVVTLLGATTENPSFEVIRALRSRCQIYRLRPLTAQQLQTIAKQALAKDELLQQYSVEIVDAEALQQYAGGDARKLLNILELLVGSHSDPKQPLRITANLLAEVLQENLAAYDKNGDWHYAITSALIKSIRGSDPNAALYWLARMLAGGEDLKFIARRLIISASEDIGLANPNAILLANQCFEAVDRIGYPESRIILSQTVIYLACSPKSNSAYQAINKAMELVEKTGQLEVPLALRNPRSQEDRQEGFGDGYLYSHAYPGHFVEQEFMPEDLRGHKLYEPAQNPQEHKFKQKLDQYWKKYR